MIQPAENMPAYRKPSLFSYKNTNARLLFYAKNAQRMLVQVIDKHNVADIIDADRITGVQENYRQQKNNYGSIIA
jgi:hypothetical protein